MSKDFKMTPSPGQMSDSGINRLWDPDGPPLPTEISYEDISRANLANSLAMWDEALKPAKALAAACERLEKIMHEPPEPTSVAELMFHTNKRHRYEFKRVPIGHDLGWCCYDPNELAGEHLTMGYGKTEDEAYVDYLNQLEDEKPVPRPGMVVHSSPFEPPTVVDAVYRDPDED